MLIYVKQDIVMRSLSKSDASIVYDVVDKNRDYLRTWLPWVDGTDSSDVTENVIAIWENDFIIKTDVVLGIFDNGKYIGNIGLHGIKQANRSGMIGYWLSEDNQGRGIITDCVRTLMDYGFCTLNLNRIYIHCAAGNIKSRAIPERLGFVQEGVLQDGEHLYGVFHDLVIYGMVKRNWNSSGTLCLIFPTLEDKESALDYKQEHINSGESHIHGSAAFIHFDDYDNWLEQIIVTQTDAPFGFVTGITYFAVVDGKIVGTLSIRHYLNDTLMKTGGHIGYGVRPSERRKGYGTKMLSLALEKCRELGIQKALITCDKNNTGSAKTIKNNGGVLENEIIDNDGNAVQRYWIVTS